MKQSSRKEGEVWKVCTLLMSQNISLTYQSIGDKLVELGYKRGSNSDIYKYLDSWKAHHFPKTSALPGHLMGLERSSDPSPLVQPGESTWMDSFLSQLQPLQQHNLEPIKLHLQPLEEKLSSIQKQLTTLTHNLAVLTVSKNTETSPLAPIAFSPTSMSVEEAETLETAQKETASYRQLMEELAQELEQIRLQVVAQSMKRHNNEGKWHLSDEQL